MKTKTKTKVNKSAAIRDVLTINPQASASDVVDALEAQGITVVPNQVYGIKAELAKKKTGAARNGNGKPHRNGTPVSRLKFSPEAQQAWGMPSNGPSYSVEVVTGKKAKDHNGYSVALVRRAKELADDCGGWAKLKELVDVLA